MVFYETWGRSFYKLSSFASSELRAICYECESLVAFGLWANWGGQMMRKQHFSLGERVDCDIHFYEVGGKNEFVARYSNISRGGRCL